MPASLFHKRRSLEIGALLPLGALCGALIGTSTNAINGWISPNYFVFAMGWENSSATQIWARSIGEGALEGCAMGAVLGLILVIFIGLTSRMRCPLQDSAPALLDTIAIAFSCWMIGGLNAVLLMLFMPQLYEISVYFGAAPGKGDILQFAWVAGSLNSLGIGGLLAVGIACARFRARWKRLVKAAENENFDFSK